MILVVDDSATQRRMLGNALRDAGYLDVNEYASAKDIFDLLCDSSFAKDVDLILLDNHMPDIDGITACMTLKENEASKDIPVIIVTASQDLETLQLAFAAGANDYISKPPEKMELVARIRASLRLKREMDWRKARERDLLELTQELEAREQQLHSITDELKRLNQQLEVLTLRDGLTGVSNRRHFDQIMDLEWRRATRQGSALSLVLLDIDAFKLYNDNYGHQKGDDCLIQVANVLQTALKRAGDMIARYGGEEFAALMPNTDLPGALVVAENLRQAVAKLEMVHAHSPVAEVVTVSLGVATMIPSQTDSFSDLIEHADQALYEAKHSGRNRVRALQALSLPGTSAESLKSPS